MWEAWVKNIKIFEQQKKEIRTEKMSNGDVHKVSGRKEKNLQIIKSHQVQKSKHKKIKKFINFFRIIIDKKTLFSEL